MAAIKSRYSGKYRGESKQVLPPSNNHDFTEEEIDTIVKKNENRLLKSKEPKLPKSWR